MRAPCAATENMPVACFSLDVPSVSRTRRLERSRERWPLCSAASVMEEFRPALRPRGSVLSSATPLHHVALLRSDSPVLPLDIRNFEIEKVDIMPSPLPFLLTLCVVLVCVWLWWRSNKQ